MRFVHLMLIPLVVASCANVQVNRVVSKNQSGIRYWRPAPYLALVQTTTKDSTQCDVKAFMLPDKTEEYAITMSAGFGTVHANPQLADGWNLTGLDASADSKTSENITALASLLKVGLDAAAGTHALADDKKALTPPKCEGVYKVIYNPDGSFARFQPVSLKLP